MNLTIEAKGISDASVRREHISIDLQEVDMSFLEDLPSYEIARNHNTEKLLSAMDSGEVFEFVRDKFDVTIKPNR